MKDFAADRVVTRPDFRFKCPVGNRDASVLIFSHSNLNLPENLRLNNVEFAKYSILERLRADGVIWRGCESNVTRPIQAYFLFVYLTLLGSRGELYCPQRTVRSMSIS